jgi:hypothetical protein
MRGIIKKNSVKINRETSSNKKEAGKTVIKSQQGA